jgi:hypothetical protein
MNETGWLTSTEPVPLLRFLRGLASERQLRLFATACCRRLWPLLDDRSRNAVDVIERCADGLASRQDLEPALAEAEAVEAVSRGPARAAARAVVTAWSTAEHACSAAAQASADPAGERRRQADLLRDVLGNPFRPIPVDLAWLERNGGRVAEIACTIYDDRRFTDLPVLADALEESGCTDEAILTHCRSGGEHTLGCWVLDRLLGTPIVFHVDDDHFIPWTVRQPVEQEGRYVRKMGCPAHFAILTLRVEPYPGPAPVVLLNATRPDRHLQAWVPAVEEGIRLFLAEVARQGKRVVGVRVLLTRLVDHPVDSRASSFERATVMAMRQAFEVGFVPAPQVEGRRVSCRPPCRGGGRGSD